MPLLPYQRTLSDSLQDHKHLWIKKSKMKQAANAAIAEHNNIINQKHSSRLVEYKVIEDSKTEKAEALRQEKISILKSIMSLV